MRGSLHCEVHCIARFTALRGSLHCEVHCIARFTALRGLAHLTFTQRVIHAVLPIKADIPKLGKPIPATPQTLGELLVACRMEAGLTQKQLALATQISRKWLGRWEHNLAVPSQEDLIKLSQILKLPEAINLHHK